MIPRITRGWHTIQTVSLVPLAASAAAASAAAAAADDDNKYICKIHVSPKLFLCALNTIALTMI